MKKGYLIVLASILMLASVSAQLFVSQPSTLYNIGDSLNLSFALTSDVPKNDFFTAVLSCGSSSVEMLKTPYALKTGDRKDIYLEIPLDKFLIGGLRGDCAISGSYGGENTETNEFIISNEVIISLDPIDFAFNPGSTFVVSGNAVKKNGQSLTGNASIKMSGTNISSTIPVSNGIFNYTLIIPNNQPSGSYDLELEAFDLDMGGVSMNTGSTFKKIKVNQVVRRVEIAFNTQEFVPGEEIIIGASAYDQADSLAERDVLFEVITPSNESLLQGSFSSKEGYGMNISNLHSPGYWTVKASAEGISTTKLFFIKPVESLHSEIINSTLVVTNDGNVKYAKDIEIFIGGEKDIKFVSLGVGESKRYNLYAPNGEYEITVKQGNEVSPIGRSFLTGNAISIEDADQIIRSVGYKWFLWGIIVLGLAYAVVYYYRKVRKKNYYGATPSKEYLSNHSYKSSSTISMSKLTRDSSKSVIEQGNKQECAIVALKVKNYNDIINSTSNALESIDSTLSRVNSYSGKVVRDGQFWMMIFPPLSTGNNNHLNAVRCAQQIEEALKEYNRRYSLKIKYGLGVTVGDLIMETGKGEFNFASVGNTIPSSKRIAEASSGDALLSDSMRKKSLGVIKTEKVAEGAWKIVKFVDRSPSSEFIDRFMKRQKSV